MEGVHKKIHHGQHWIRSEELLIVENGQHQQLSEVWWKPPVNIIPWTVVVASKPKQHVELKDWFTWRETKNWVIRSDLAQITCLAIPVLRESNLTDLDARGLRMSNQSMISRWNLALNENKRGWTSTSLWILEVWTFPSLSNRWKKLDAFLDTFGTENNVYMDLTPAWRNLSVSLQYHEHQTTSGIETPAPHEDVDTL